VPAALYPPGRFVVLISERVKAVNEKNRQRLKQRYRSTCACAQYDKFCYYSWGNIEQAMTHVMFRFCAPILPNFPRAYLPCDRLNLMFRTISNSSLKKIFILHYLNASLPLLESMWFYDYRSCPALQSRSVNISNTVNWRHAMKSAGSGTVGNISHWILELIPLSPVSTRGSPSGGPHLPSADRLRCLSGQQVRFLRLLSSRM
jgi:hypothetical protein